MKKLLQQTAILCFTIFLISNSAFSANEYFRSITSGDWNSISTWEMSLNNSTWVPATSTPDQTSAVITVRSPNTVNVTSNVSADQLVINSGAILFVNSGVIITILNGSSYDLTVNDSAFVDGPGTVRSQGVGTSLYVDTYSYFLADFTVNTGTTTVLDPSSPYEAKLYGIVTVDGGATLDAGNSAAYDLELYGDVLNNGTINAVGSKIVFRCQNFINNSVVSANINMDTVTSLSGSGSYTGANLVINASGNVILANNITFSPSSTFTVNNGGILNSNSNISTLNSGTFILNTGGTVFNSGSFRTQGTVTLSVRNGSVFNAPLNVNTGSTIANESISPYIANFFNNVTIDNGATLNTGGSIAYNTVVYGTVTNYGTITGSGDFIVHGPGLINNSSINPSSLKFNSACNISGAGTFTSANILIDTAGSVTLSSSVTFSPATKMEINNGGILKPNAFTFTFNSGAFYCFSGGTVLAGGLFRTQNTVTLNIRTGSAFNSALNVNTGTTTAGEFSSPYNGRFYGNLTIENGATLSTNNSSAYDTEFYGTVTNNGLISGSGHFILRGSSLINNNSITSVYFALNSTCNVSGAGSFTSNHILIDTNASVTLLSNLTFSPVSTLDMLTGGTLNPNSNVFNLNSGTFEVSSGAVVSNSGTFRTQGTVTLNIRNGSSFNAPLNVTSGNTQAYEASSPYDARLYGNITIDNGASLDLGNSPSYSLEVFANIINNGAILGAAGADLIFSSGVHTLTGSGYITPSAFVSNGSSLTLSSDHDMYSMDISAGGVFDISNRRLGFTASDPILNNGTFTTINSDIEYNGTVLQYISYMNITYSGLRVNNPAGTRLFEDLTIPDTLAVILGDLNLSGKIITITPTGYMTETSGNTVFGISGYIVTTRNIGTPTSLNVAGMGAVLTASSNLGSTEIRRGHTVQTGLNGGTSIKRYYDISPTNNSGLTASLVFKFDDSELNGKPEPSLKLFKSTNSGSTWLFMGGSVNIAANEITLTGLNSFSRWSADSSGVSAAITLLMEGFYNNVSNQLSLSDTVRAYLRNVSSPYAVVDSAIGVVDSLTFKSAFQFNNAASGTYYLQLKHRNSLETWSKNGVVYIMDSTLNYDFTFAATQAFGNNTIQKGSKYCLYSGDVTQDGFIDLTDVLNIYNNATAFINGYVVTDVNGDMITDLSDVLIAYNNAIKFITAKSPINP
jgi:hypothetical protein